MPSTIRQRARKPKVRTGCVTCKIRRVKCDEQKPHCLRCTSTGRRCDGYEVLLPRSESPNSRSAIVRTDSIARSFSSGIEGDDLERRSFHFFCNRTASEISGYVSSEFWETLLLQASHSAPAVLHAVIALGSLHEIYEHSTGCLENSQALDQRSFALQQSSKSIKHLRSELEQSTPQSGEVVLICCLLFICLETFQGNYEAALAHLNSGLKILGSLIQDDNNSMFDTKSVTYQNRAFVLDSIAPLFTRLDVQASTYVNTRPVNYEMVAQDEVSIIGPPIPTSFSSLNEANDSLNKQLHWMLHYECVAWQHLSLARSGASGQSPDGLISMFLAAQDDHRTQLERWLHTLNVYLIDPSSKMGAKELRGAILLKIHHIIIKILLEAMVFDYETGFDDLVGEFGRMITLAESMSNIRIASSDPVTKPSYSFDMGLIPPLYYTACRCRDPVIRRQALSLLSASPRREGVWDSVVCSAIARWLINLEEGGLEVVSCAEDVPLKSRIYIVERSFTFGERQCLVKFLRGKRNEYNGLHSGYEEEWISW